MTRNAWFVRSGSGNEIIQKVESEGLVAIGAGNVSNLRQFKTRADVLAEYKKRNPDESVGQVYLRGGQLWKFAHEIQDGDIVLTSKKATRQILIGFINGNYRFDPKAIPDYPHTRSVSWSGKIERDDLKPTLRNSVGSISTVFSLTRFLPDLEGLLHA